jgi:hypothetical protein
VYFHGFLTKEGVWPPDEVAGICIRAAKGPGTLLFLVALAAVAGLFLTALRVRTDLTHCLKLEDVSDCVRAYLRLKRYQDRFLALAGVILGASVVTAVLLIRAYNTPGAGLPSHHPETFSYTYAFAHAGFFSLGLAVAFLVARQPLLAVGESLRERLTGAPPGAAGDIGPWLAADREAKALLQLRAYSLPAVAEAASILAPLIGAVVPALLGGV